MTSLVNKLLKLSEEISQSFYTFVYHRTDDLSIIQDIVERDFKPAKHGAYSPGIYVTYNLKSQLRPLMRQWYGDYLLKLRLRLHHFIHFDKTVMQSLFGKLIPPGEQLRQLDPIVWKKFAGPLQKADNIWLHHQGRTSKKFIKIFANLGVRSSKVYGLTYTDRDDGNAAVIFRADALIPVAYGKEENGTVHWTYLTIEKYRALARKKFSILGVTAPEKLSQEELLKRVFEDPRAMDQYIAKYAKPSQEKKLYAIPEEFYPLVRIDFSSQRLFIGKDQKRPYIGVEERLRTWTRDKFVQTIFSVIHERNRHFHEFLLRRFRKFGRLEFRERKTPDSVMIYYHYTPGPSAFRLLKSPQRSWAEIAQTIQKAQDGNIDTLLLRTGRSESDIDELRDIMSFKTIVPLLQRM